MKCLLNGLGALEVVNFAGLSLEGSITSLAQLDHGSTVDELGCQSLDGRGNDLGGCLVLVEHGTVLRIRAK